jgi:alpha-1,3-rhamnosyltransferase
MKTTTIVEGGPTGERGKPSIEGAQPLVSMLIPSFNHGEYVQACIKSVISQDYQNIELMIIDDGSVDDSVQKIRQLIPECQSRFARFEFRSRPNKGLANTINEALEWSGGEYFASIASDDWLYANKTSILLENFDEDENLAGVFGGCELVDENGSVTRTISPPPQYYEYDDVILREHTIMASAQLLRLDSVRAVGGYQPGIYIEDWYMWLQLTRNNYKLKVISEPLAKYRQHDSNISKNAWKMYEARKTILQAHKEHRYYNLSMAKISVMAAIDCSWFSKIDSSRLLHEAVSYSPKILASRFFYYGLARLFVPCSLVFYLQKHQ